MAPSKNPKNLPAAPLSKKTKTKETIKKVIEKNPKNYRIGGDIQPKRDLRRFVRWPKYIRLQRQKQILLQRLKVPPALNQFNNPINKNYASQLIKLLDKYKPETKIEKKSRLIKKAEKQEEGQKQKASNKPVLLKYGLNHVTDLIELKKAKLVVIAHDVDPVELVVWLPALCRRMDVPYCIIKGKSRLGKLVHQKKTCVVAVDNIRKEDSKEFDTLCKNFKELFNDDKVMQRKWGGGIMGIKSQHATAKQSKIQNLEVAKRMGIKH